jgi:23S rRNA (guanosine2251-2'-O)-methyltransferase
MAKQDDIIFGFHAVEAALRNDAANILQLLVEKDRHDQRLKQLVQLAESQGISIELLRKTDLEKRCHSNHTQGIAARYRSSPTKETALEDLLDKTDLFLLVLDGVTDPHNLGACLRSADAAGVDAVIAPKDRAVGLTPVVRKVACGAAESVPFIQVTNLARTLKELQDAGVWIVGTAGEAEQFIYDVDLKGRLALIMGAEEKGMRRLTREHCNALVKLPMAGQVESLNVSVATGVCLFEAVRQRRVV